MTEFKGRHLGFLLILCGTWAASRFVTNFTPVETPAKAIAAISSVIPAASAYSPPFAIGAVPAHGRPAAAFAPRDWHRAPSPGTPDISDQPTAYPAAAPIFPANADHPLLPPTASARTSRRTLTANIYAYSFWRFQASGQGFAAGGQYGGGQSGLIATIGFVDGRNPNPPLALMLRTTVAHNNLRDREFAAGARWQPNADWPVSITAERRFGNIGPDRFALYVAGGHSNIPLPAQFRLETYAQAGVVSGQDGGHFFDAQARADRRVPLLARLPIFVGAGVWTGGQRGAARLDIGPSLRTEIPVGDTAIRLTADWRFRIAGGAAPGNGPALTLSTGF